MDFTGWLYEAGCGIRCLLLAVRVLHAGRWLQGREKGKIPARDCALFLAKVIYHGLTVANATAWQFWNAWEPGSAEFDSRYYLLALNINAANTDGDFAVTKNLWALGHYSRFIRPDMKRIVVVRKDESDSRKAAQDVMLCAFTGKKELVVVAVNYTTSSRDILLDMPGVKRNEK